MQFEWDERKRASNLKEHGFDFTDAAEVFAGLTATYEDDRFRYNEQRFVTLGLLDEMPVSIVHTESSDTVRIISFRRATQHESEFLFQNISSAFPEVSDQTLRQESQGRDKADRRTSRARHGSRRSGHRKKGP